MGVSCYLAATYPTKPYQHHNFLLRDKLSVGRWQEGHLRSQWLGGDASLPVSSTTVAFYKPEPSIMIVERFDRVMIRAFANSSALKTAP